MPISSGFSASSPSFGRLTASWITTRTARSAVRKCETLPKGPDPWPGETTDGEFFLGWIKARKWGGEHPFARDFDVAYVGNWLGTDAQDLCSSGILAYYAWKVGEASKQAWSVIPVPFPLNPHLQGISHCHKFMKGGYTPLPLRRLGVSARASDQLFFALDVDKIGYWVWCFACFRCVIFVVAELGYSAENMIFVGCYDCCEWPLRPIQ